MSIRDRLIEEDSTGCLQLLMRYPPDQSVSQVIGLAIDSGGPGGAHPVRYAAGSYPPTMPSTATDRHPGFPTAQSSTPDPSSAWMTDGYKAGWGGGAGAEAGRNSGRWNPDSRTYPPLDRRLSGERSRAGAGAAAGVPHEEAYPTGWGQEASGAENTGDAKNQWQQGLDQLTRRYVRGSLAGRQAVRASGARAVGA